ncbi:hypothetical protein C8R44DRAFT_784863 [Mycena epipterygia]|nr:hypothetical protein C8R44DRAFT_784863 [Mycena epipterygia]
MSLAAFFKALLLFQLAADFLPSTSASTQFAFRATAEASDFVNSEFYRFKWPIRRVAIIGAGVRCVPQCRGQVVQPLMCWECSGLLAYRELVDAGFEKVKIFERDAVPGGVWHYTEETPVKAPVPNHDPKIADYVPSLPPRGNAMPLERWYADHNDNLTHTLLARYLRSVYSFFGINSNDESPNTSYSTRVELVEKRFDANGIEQGWTLTLKKFIRLGPSSSKERWWTEDFDAVVIATGTFNAPNIPNIPGLEEWTRCFPGSFLHSREYRHPEKFANQSVLVVGAGPSATGISADLNPFVKRNYLSLRLLPQGVEIVVGINRFHASNSTIELSDGTLLTDIDHIIFSTGYRYTFPFLPQYHNSSIGPNDEGLDGQPRPLVTDGTHFRSLYREFIYIEEPTLGFMNLNIGTTTWTFGECFAVALAKIWTGTAMLPNQTQMWKSYRADIATRGGYGKWLPLLNGPMQDNFIWFFTAWLNSAAFEFGGKQVDGKDKNYNEITRVWQQAFFANPNPVPIPSNHSEFQGFNVGAADWEPSFFDYRY